MERIANYFPRVSERITNYDYLTEMVRRSQTPSFLKKRAAYSVPVLQNAWNLWSKHIVEMSYVTEVAEQYAQVRNLYAAPRIANAIREKYGTDRMATIRGILDRASLHGVSESYSASAHAFRSIINNFVTAKITGSIKVFANQLTAFTNYIVDMPTTDFIKNFSYGLTHPAEVNRVMKGYVGDILDARYKDGQVSGLIQDVMKRGWELTSSDKILDKIVSPGTRKKIDDMFSYFIRKGDILPIKYGGYAYVKYLEGQGLSEKEIRDRFAFRTSRSQTSGLEISKSPAQASSVLRVFNPFLNTVQSYNREMYDAYINYKRGEINGGQFLKVTFNYAILNSFMYGIVIPLLFKAMDDDDDKYRQAGSDFLATIFGLVGATNPYMAFGSSALSKYVADKIMGIENSWYNLEPLILAEVNKLSRSSRRIVAGDGEGKDYIDSVAVIVEGLTKLPVSRYVRGMRKLLDD